MSDTMQITLVPTAQLSVAPWNARKTFDEASIAELAASIAERGVLVPLTVRRLDFGSVQIVNGAGDKVDALEIVAGHRRWRASERAGLTELPCIICDLTDDEAREVGLVDNLQREDVPALEEADAYVELQQRVGTPAAIALRVGKDVTYVVRRLQLASLAAAPRQALAERLITVDHALLLARLGESEQDVNLKWCLNPNAGVKVPVATVIAEGIKGCDANSRWGAWEPESALSLKNHIEQNVGRKLSRAPWDLEDVALAGAVACTACASNTKANDTLFGDLAIDGATCEDGACFERKRDAFVQIRLRGATTSPKADASKGPAIRLSWKQTTVKPRASKPGAEFDGDGFSLSQVFKDGQWVEAKAKSCEHVRLGVTIDWSDDAHRGYMGNGEKLRKPGQILSVCIAEKCKAHPKAWENTKKESSGAPKEKVSPEEAKRRAETTAFRMKHEELRYLSLRGLLIRCPDDPQLVRVNLEDDAGEKGGAL